MNYCNNKPNGLGFSVFNEGLSTNTKPYNYEVFTGTVLNANTNNILEGPAHIFWVENGITKGVITDANGNFTFTAPLNSIIRITHQGFTDYESLARDLDKTVFLFPEYESLNEVVVTNKKPQPKSNLTIYLGLGILALIIGNELNKNKN